MSSNADIWLSKESSEPAMAAPQSALKGNAYLEFITQDWVKELKDQKQINAVKVRASKSLADLHVKCHAVPTRKKLQQELETIANRIAMK